MFLNTNVLPPNYYNYEPLPIISDSITSLSAEQDNDTMSRIGDCLQDDVEQIKTADYLQQLNDLRIQLQQGKRSYFAMEKKRYNENSNPSLSFEAKIEALDAELLEIYKKYQGHVQSQNAREQVKCEMQTRIRYELKAALIIDYLFQSLPVFLSAVRSGAAGEIAQVAAHWKELKAIQLTETGWWQGYKSQKGVVAQQIEFHQSLVRKCDQVFAQLMGTDGTDSKDAQPEQAQPQGNTLKRERETNSQTSRPGKRQKCVVSSRSSMRHSVSLDQTKFPLSLPNIGNSCYINVALQIVFKIDDLHDKIFQSKDELITSIASLCTAKTGLKMEYILSDIRRTLSDQAGWKSLNLQQDANEVLLMILDRLDWTPIKMYTRIQNGSELYDLAPQQCNQLSMPFSAPCLQDIVDDYFKFEQMVSEDQNKPWVLNSNGIDHVLSSWQQAICIDEYPRHLVLELKQPAQRGQKKKTVEFPQDQIVTFPHSEGPVKYEIVAFVNHRNINSRSNHYTALINSEEQQSWLHCNDTKISSAGPISKSTDVCLVLLKKIA